MSILVIAEHDNNNLKGATLNTLSAATKLTGEVNLLVIGSNVDNVVEESQLLAISSISMTSGDVKGSTHIKISQIKSDTKQFEILDNNKITKLLQAALEKYTVKEKSS